jgi:hypothetical protein
MQDQYQTLEQKRQTIVNHIETMKNEYDMRLIEFEEDYLRRKKK